MSPTSPDAPGRWSQRANQLIVAAVIIGCAVALNAVFSQLHWRLDLTSDGIYTLSPVSETTVQNLEQPVDIRVFLSADMPPPYHRLGDQIEELLLEYRAADDANIDFQIVTPDDTDDIEELARGYGIEPVTIGRQTDTSRSYQSVYKGVAFMQGDRQETIADLEVSPQSGIDGFEYEFTRALKNLESQTPRRVGVVTGLGGPADHAGFVERFDTVFQQLYGQLVRLEAVDVAAGDDLQDLEAVVAINLEGDLGEEGLRNLDRFVQQGGNVGWFQSGGVVDDEQRRQMLEHRRQGLAAEPLRRRPTNTDLVDYFRALGLELRADAVIDRSRAIAHGVVPTAEGPVQVSHPALFAIDDIARELPFARHYSTLVIPLPATVRLDERAIGDGVEATSVLRTADTSVRLPTAPDVALYDALIDEIDGEQQGSYTVAAALQGAMPSYFDDGADDLAASDARLLVVGSGDFIGEYPDVGYVGQLTGLGMQFFLNSVEWLAQQDDLADIRNKSMPELVSDVPPGARRSMQFINIAVVPALFASIGVLMMIRRRKRKEQWSADASRPEETGQKDEDRG